MPDTVNDFISLIPKKDKDVTDPSHFRSVSLINVDSKVLAKVLATCLEKVLPSIVHTDLVAKDQSSMDNMRRLLHLMWIASSDSDVVAAVSLYAKKKYVYFLFL